MFMFAIEYADLFAIEYAELHGVECDWCEDQASGRIYSALPVQNACDEHLGEWLRGQAYAIDGADVASA